MNRKKIWKNIYEEIGRLSETLDKNMIFFLFGFNSYAEGIINEFRRKGIYIRNILDNSGKLIGKNIGECKIISPEEITAQLMENAVVFVASQHEQEMRRQLENMFPGKKIKMYLLYDFKTANLIDEEEKKYWEKERCDKQVRRLELGRSVYESWKREGEWLILSPTVSIGDNFLWALSLDQFKRENEMECYQILTASAGAKRTVELFGEQEVEAISPEEMDVLCKFILFVGENDAESIILYPRFFSLRCLDIMASWKSMTWQQIYTDYLFQLNGKLQLNFPDIWSDAADMNQISELGIKKGKTVILSPYANTVGEVPLIFWERLVQELKKRGFLVLTNITGAQIPISGSKGIDIPLSQSGSYLEYAGYFISIRNGLCDVIGKAKCRQIVIFRDRKQLHSSEKEFNDLHVNIISESAIEMIYKEDYYNRTIEEILQSL